MQHPITTRRQQTPGSANATLAELRHYYAARLALGHDTPCILPDPTAVPDDAFLSDEQDWQDTFHCLPTVHVARVHTPVRRRPSLWRILWWLIWPLLSRRQTRTLSK